MDIEGFEQKAQKGAIRLLESATEISGAIAAYHTHEAEDEIRSLLEEKNFKTQTTKGFLFFEDEMRCVLIRFYS